MRWNSVYDKDMVKVVNEKDYKPNRRSQVEMNSYNYCHDENLKSIVTEGRKKNEDSIRERR